MPVVIIREREDTNDKIKLNVNGNIRIIDRMKPTKVTQSELDVLMGSHEASFVIVSKSDNLINDTVTFLDIEEINGDTDSTIRVDADNRGNETGAGQNSKLRGAGKSA